MAQHSDPAAVDDSAVPKVVLTEVDRRRTLWVQLVEGAGPQKAEPSVLRTLGVYRGQAGIYFNGEVTRSELAPRGVAVAFRHDGSRFDEDLAEDGVIWHYPTTNRAGSHDAGEIASALAAFRLGIPVFIVIGPKAAPVRTVRLGYVEQADETAGLLLITFTDDVLPAGWNAAADPFDLHSPPALPVLKAVRERPNQERFRAAVLTRYGMACAVCSVTVPALLQAAHLVPKKTHGSDDARNGLPLCANHHLAYDAGLWAITPDTTAIVTRTATNGDLMLTKTDLQHLPAQPHPDSIAAAWTRFPN